MRELAEERGEGNGMQTCLGGGREAALRPVHCFCVSMSAEVHEEPLCTVLSCVSAVCTLPTQKRWFVYENI